MNPEDRSLAKREGWRLLSALGKGLNRKEIDCRVGNATAQSYKVPFPRAVLNGSLNSRISSPFPHQLGQRDMASGKSLIGRRGRPAKKST